MHSILLVLLTRLALINIQCLPRFSLHYQEIVINVNRERDKCLSFRPSFESINSSKWHAVGLNCWLSDARISSIPAPFRRLMRTGSFSSNFKGKTVNVDRIILPYSSDSFSHWQCSTLLNYRPYRPLMSCVLNTGTIKPASQAASFVSCILVEFSSILIIHSSAQESSKASAQKLWTIAELKISAG